VQNARALHRAILLLADAARLDVRTHAAASLDLGGALRLALRPAAVLRRRRFVRTILLQAPMPL
jgi:hypothetical protein